MSVTQFGYAEQLRRALGIGDLVVFGLIFMVPISPFSVYGFVAEDAKGMVPMAYLVGLVGMFFTALSYAAMSRAFPLAGSVYTYAARGLHEAAGFFAGWLILLDYLLVPSLLYLISAAALRPLFPAVPAWVWLGSLIFLNAAVNWFGVEFTARLNRYLLLFQLAVLATFLALALVRLYGGAGAGRLTLRPLYDPAVFSVSTVVGATSVAVLSFLGFDGISTLAEESRGVTDAVGRATVISLLLVGALFMAQTWVAADLARGMQFAAADTAFYDIARRAGGDSLQRVIVVAVVVSGSANAMAAQAAVARVLFAMARDRKLPAILARIHPRHQTPYMSAMCVSLVSLGVVGFFLSRIDDLARVVNFGALCGFVLLHLAVINHYVVRGARRGWLRYAVCPALGLVVILYVLFEMDRSAKLVGACWLAAGALYYGALKLRRRPADAAPI